MFVVHRLPLGSSVNVFVIPESSKVLSVGVGKGGVPSMWYTVEDSDPAMFQVVVIDSIPTGHVVESDAARVFIGTVNAAGKVYHLFKRGSLPVIEKAKAVEMAALSPEALRQAVDELLELSAG
jgi:hypothetical protein